MAPLPKRRHSTARSGERQKAKTLSPLRLVVCPNCHQPKKPHRVCPSCGYYNNKLIFPKEDENHR